MVEKWLHAAKVRVDAFGFGDLLALDGTQGALLIQACVAGDISTRRKKILEERADNARAWLKHGNGIEVWGWGKRGPLKRWTLIRWGVYLDSASAFVVRKIEDAD